jgi:two-component system, chemotaxis family, response regulator PixH
MVINVRTGEEAQEKLRQQKPDLIVLDVILPGLSGFELCRELKGNASTSTIPIIIRSSKSTEADQMWGRMLGADAYVPKSENHQDLIHTVRQLLKS